MISSNRAIGFFSLSKKSGRNRPEGLSDPFLAPPFEPLQSIGCELICSWREVDTARLTNFEVSGSVSATSEAPHGKTARQGPTCIGVHSEIGSGACERIPRLEIIALEEMLRRDSTIIPTVAASTCVLRVSSVDDAAEILTDARFAT